MSEKLKNIERVVINTAAGSTVEIKAAVAGKKIKVYGGFLTLASGTLIIKSATTALTGAMTLTTLQLPIMDFGGGFVPWFETVAGDALNFTFSGAVQCSGVLFVTDSDAT